MKYPNGTVVKFTDDEKTSNAMSKLPEEFNYKNVATAVKVGAYDLLVYHTDGTTIVDSFDMKVNDIIKLGKATTPEKVGINTYYTLDNINYKGKSKDIRIVYGDMFFVDKDYFENVTGIKSQNLYNGLVPVITLSSSKIMLLGEYQGSVLELPIDVHKLAKHSPKYLEAEESMFMLMP